MTHPTENDAHCIVCGLRLWTASEWCTGTRDGYHLSNLPGAIPPVNGDGGAA